MKKFISFAAFALLATMSLSFVSCSDDDEPALPEVPTNWDEAQAMLVGQWQCPSVPPFADEAIWEFGKDLKVIQICKIKKTVSIDPGLKVVIPTSLFKEYAGQYVGIVAYKDWLVDYDFGKDGGTGKLVFWKSSDGRNHYEIDLKISFYEMTRNSFKDTVGEEYDNQWTRVTKPVKYTLIDTSEY